MTKSLFFHCYLNLESERFYITMSEVRNTSIMQVRNRTNAGKCYLIKGASHLRLTAPSIYHYMKFCFQLSDNRWHTRDRFEIVWNYTTFFPSLKSSKLG